MLFILLSWCKKTKKTQALKLLCPKRFCLAGVITISEMGDNGGTQYVTIVLCFWQSSSFWQGSAQSVELAAHTHTHTEHGRKAMIWKPSAILGTAVSLSSCLSIFLIWFTVVFLSAIAHWQSYYSLFSSSSISCAAFTPLYILVFFD